LKCFYFSNNPLSVFFKTRPNLGIYSNLLALVLFQTCMNFFVLLNTKDVILKNVGNQIDFLQNIFSRTKKLMQV